MESPVVVDKPPEYHGNDRGFPFEEEEGSGAWSELAARHPDIAARLRQRPATWARKRRPSSQDTTEDFGESFSGFDRFPFDDIPPEFRGHFPSHWNRRHSDRDRPPPEHHSPPAPAPPPHQHTAATQTEPSEHTLPQYGLRNTVDLGQKSPADPSVDDDRGQRSMSAPPDAPRTLNPEMSANQQEARPPHDHHSNVRHIPIFVEGRDEPVINRDVDHGTHFGESKPQPPPAQAHLDRDQYFADDGPVGFHHPPNFTRAFGTPFNKGFRQGPQPFTQQKAYPQNAFARGASPQRAHSPHRQEEHFVKVPVHHEHAPPSTEPSSRAQQKHSPQQKQPPPQQKQPSPQRQQPSPQPREQTPPPKPQHTPNDPITQILSIQTDVLNLMTEVENFKGTKKDKRYLFLDEMLTRNLIKLDNIETDGKENIRQARKEAIRCIQKCIAVLEAKAESNSASGVQPQTQDVEMNEGSESTAEPALAENGQVEMKEVPQEEKADTQQERIDDSQPQSEQIKDVKEGQTPKPEEEQTKNPNSQEEQTKNPNSQEQTQNPETPAVPARTEAENPSADTRPEEHKPEQKTEEQKKEIENKPNKKKVVKKRDKSKDADKVKDTDKVKNADKGKDEEESKDGQTKTKNKEAPKESTEEESKDSNKTEVAQKDEKVEVMQVDEKGDKPMEVDGAASQ